MKRLEFLLLAIVGALSACATGYSLVAPGPVTVQDLHLLADAGWNKAPGMGTPSVRNNAETWTKDGMLLDRLVISPAIPDGQPIMVSRDKSAALPAFRADMLPNELEELVESSLVKMFGEGNAVVRTSNLRPFRYGATDGIRFSVEATVTDSPQYLGTVGAFVAHDQLYLMYFLAAVPYYFDKHRAEAEAVIQSATL